MLVETNPFYFPKYKISVETNPCYISRPFFLFCLYPSPFIPHLCLRLPSSFFFFFFFLTVGWLKYLLYVHRNHMFIRDGSPGRPSRLSHSS